MNGQTWVAFQGNLRVKLPAQILQGDDLEKPVFKLPEPAMARINEILTDYVSKCESAGPAVRVHVKVPQPQKKHRTAGKKRKAARQEKTKKVSKMQRRLRSRRAPRGKEAKHTRCKAKKSSIARNILRMRSRRNPVTKWTMRKHFKLEWNRSFTRNQRKKASRRQSQRRASRVAVVKATQQMYSARDLYFTFKKELVTEISNRKIRATKVSYCRMLSQLKQLQKGSPFPGKHLKA
jgi:hypothetical protein